MYIRTIRNIAASIIGLVLIALGFVKRAKEKFSKSGNLMILYFHNPGEKYFAKVVRWLKNNGFSFLEAQDVVEYFKNGKSLPKCPVWLTFDDGWRGNYKNVYPVLKNENITATIFAVTRSIETSGVFWWTYSEKYKHLLPEKFKDDFSLLWKIPEQLRENVTEDIYNVIKESLDREAISVDELKEMSESGHVTFGSHTVNHIIAPNCTDEEMTKELLISKQKLEEWTGKSINIFCYPNSDYTERDTQLLTDAGYDIAVIAGNRFAGKNDNRYRIPRMGMGEAYFPEELCHMFGVWQKFIKRIKN